MLLSGDSNNSNTGCLFVIHMLSRLTWVLWIKLWTLDKKIDQKLLKVWVYGSIVECLKCNTIAVYILQPIFKNNHPLFWKTSPFCYCEETNKRTFFLREIENNPPPPPNPTGVGGGWNQKNIHTSVNLSMTKDQAK